MADLAVPAAFKRVQRACLNCKAKFDSAWAGERICQRCKGTTSWRNGGGVTTSNQNQSRTGRKGGS